MAHAFDTLAAARNLENAGMNREHAEAVAGAIRDGQGELATKDDIVGLRWIVGINIVISLATLAAVISLAVQP